MKIHPDTLNKFVVGSAANGTIVILNPPLQARRRAAGIAGDTMPEWPAVAPLTVSEALNLAAWLVAVSGRRDEFDRLLEAIQAT